MHRLTNAAIKQPSRLAFIARRLRDGRVVTRTQTSTALVSSVSGAGALSCFHSKYSLCEHEIYHRPKAMIEESYVEVSNKVNSTGIKSLLAKAYKKFRKFVRVFLRAIELMAMAAPLIALYPIARLGYEESDDDELHLQVRILCCSNVYEQFDKSI